ncbi:MAG: Ig-like domain-containing protein, partial [Anaerolineae bacterium]
DFSDPPAAFISHQVNLGGSVHAVASAGSLAYAGLTNGNVVVVDMQSGTVLQTISAGAAAIEDLSTEKENLFVLLDSQLRAYSVAQGILTFQGQVATSGYFAEGITGRKRLFVGGGFAYATSYPGYDVFNVQNLASPLRVGTPSTPGPNSFKQIVANGSGLGVATVGVNPRNDGTHDLWLYDVSDPTRTGDLLTTFGTPDVARAVAIYNGLAYVADSTGGLHVMSYLAYDTQGIPPTIALSTNFVPGQAEEGKLMRVTAAVADDSQVRTVQFFVDGVQAQIDGNFPFEVRFITPRIGPPPAPGRPGQPQSPTFTLRARAIDTGGNATWSDTMTVTLTTDATAPQVTLVAPASNSVNIQGEVSAVAVTFSEPVDPASLTAATFRLFNAGNDGQLGTGDDQLVSGGVIEYRSDVNMAVLSFGAPLPPQLYRVDVSTGVTDLVGNALVAAFSSTFRVNQPVTWVSDNSGFWDVGSNWSGGSAPTASDFVIISRPSAAITVTVRFGGATARRVTSDETLEITGGTLTVATPSTNAGLVKISSGARVGSDWVLQHGLAWSGGTVDVANARMTVTGAVSISGSATKSLWRGTLDLLGTTTWSGSGAI